MGDTLGKPVTDKYSRTLESELLAVGATSMQGWRRGMEDAHTTILDLKGSSKGTCAFFAVFDGHCGQASALYSEHHLHEKLASLEEFKRGDWEAALKRAFLEHDAELEAKPDKHEGSGCTAVVCLVTPDGSMVVANVGDSRCVLSRGGRALPLSFDHKPSNEEEWKRINNAGAFVSGGRVNGNLALSRAIGDFEFKQNASLKREDQSITANPEITVTTIEPTDDFVVLACDGIWDMMTSDEVVHFVSWQLKATPDELARVCEDTCDRCLAPQAPGLGCDNMTMMVVKLKPEFKQLLGLEVST